MNYIAVYVLNKYIYMLILGPHAKSIKGAEIFRFLDFKISAQEFVMKSPSLQTSLFLCSEYVY